MSEYTVNTVRFTAQDRMFEATAGMFQVPRAWVSSSVLSDLATPIPPVGEPAAALTSRWQAIDGASGVRDVLAAAAGRELATAEELSTRAHEAIRAGQTEQAGVLAAAADQALRQALNSSVSQMRGLERQATTAATRKALTDLGYAVTAAHGDRSAGLWAERGHAVVAVLVHDGGAMEVDIAGLAGGSCLSPMRELQQSLKNVGLEVRAERRVDHGDDRGGSLIRRAGQVGAQSMAEGLVRQHEGSRPARQQPLGTAGAADPPIRMRSGR